MKISDGLRAVVMAFTVAAFVYSVRTRKPSGHLVHVPYDFRFPTMRRVRERLWNPEDPRIITPTVFGVGWTLNLYQVAALWKQPSGENSETDTPQ